MTFAALVATGFLAAGIHAFFLLRDRTSEFHRVAFCIAAAPEVTLRLLVIALGIGAVVLLPSLYYLFRIFKGSATSNTH